MGAHHSHEKSGSDHGGTSTPRNGSRGSASSAELQVKAAPQPTSMVPVEKLTKLLAQRSQKEDGVNGITEKSFTKYLFPMYPDLARHFYRYIHHIGECKNKHISLSTFKKHCERILAMLDDNLIIETYIRMFSMETDEGSMTPEGFRSLLRVSYKMSMDHHPEGPQACMDVERTLAAVVNGCFSKQECHSVGFVVRWVEQHCRRVIFPVHRYCVHAVATRYRDLEDPSAHLDDEGSGVGLELSTPVLDRAPPTPSDDSLLPVSRAWLLAAAAPPLYSRAVTPPRAAWLSRLICAVPSHWVRLYASRDHGLGVNRFLHHTLAYRGPTLLLIRGEDQLVALAVPCEWRETHQYWGGPECCLLQLLPTFGVVEQAPKMVYLNTSIRGYPHGVRAGSDPRQPLLSINEHFDGFSLKGVPYPLHAVEVWGCGDQSSRETQLEIKKWQVKEAERQRQVKLSAADWIEHPDRYLLELAGRPQYNNTAS